MGLVKNTFCGAYRSPGMTLLLLVCYMEVVFKLTSKFLSLCTLTIASFRTHQTDQKCFYAQWTVVSTETHKPSKYRMSMGMLNDKW